MGKCIMFLIPFVIGFSCKRRLSDVELLTQEQTENPDQNFAKVGNSKEPNQQQDPANLVFDGPEQFGQWLRLTTEADVANIGYKVVESRQACSDEVGFQEYEVIDGIVEIDLLQYPEGQLFFCAFAGKNEGDQSGDQTYIYSFIHDITSPESVEIESVETNAQNLTMTWNPGAEADDSTIVIVSSAVESTFTFVNGLPPQQPLSEGVDLIYVGHDRQVTISLQADADSSQLRVFAFDLAFNYSAPVVISRDAFQWLGRDVAVNNPVFIGTVLDQVVYLCRVDHTIDGQSFGRYPGFVTTLSDGTKRCVYTFNQRSYDSDAYQRLAIQSGDFSDHFQWVPYNAATDYSRGFQGGHNIDGLPIYICRIRQSETVLAGWSIFQGRTCDAGAKLGFEARTRI